MKSEEEIKASISEVKILIAKADNSDQRCYQEGVLDTLKWILEE